MFRFAEIGWLFALAVVPVAAALLVLAGRGRQKALSAFADHALARKLTDTVSTSARS